MPSTVIRGFHYQPDEQALEITFVSGRSYRYLRVPPKVCGTINLSSIMM